MGVPRILQAAAARLLPLILLASACKKQEDWERLNADGECLRVDVAPVADGGDDDSADGGGNADDDDDSAVPADHVAGDCLDVTGDMACIPLHGRANFFGIEIIGQATVSPTSGPAGTRFDVGVELLDTGDESGNPVDVVDRATVRVDNGEVIVDEFDMSESPADERRWTLRVGAGGDPATTRRPDDGLCITLYALVE